MEPFNEMQGSTGGTALVDEPAGNDPTLEHGEHRAQPAQHGIARARLLIIEDYRYTHDLIKTHLADEPYDFLSAYDASSGLAMAKSAGIDLVLLDLDLPDTNGFDVCRHLKADRATANIAVIFLTASTGLDEKEVGMGLEASDYITKPFDPRELSVRIRAALRVKRLLDLLPSNERGTETIACDAPGADHHAMMRLPLNKVIYARKMNPWGRRRPDANN